MSKNWDTAIAAYEGALEFEDFNELDMYMRNNLLTLGICSYFNYNENVKEKVKNTMYDIGIFNSYLCTPFIIVKTIEEAKQGIRTRIEFLKLLKSKYPNEPE